ncbi:MAG: methionyl-tRNA formyltransferase, partial [Gemmobacter sp.]|nr:methionyl-tRNA formyltransferase [Gemmobacter sp.]
IMQMEAGLDTGPVLLREAITIGAHDTTADLHDRLSVMGARMILDALSRLHSLVPQPQPTSGVTYATKIDKAEARIDWTQSAEAVDRQIRALSPFPGAWCDMAGERLKLLRSTLAPGQGSPGQILGGSGLTVACGTGAVQITELQREGKRSLPTADALRGLTLPGALG